MLNAGQRPLREYVHTRPIRLLEIEKVRMQPFSKGVHPFRMQTASGLKVFPSGDALNRFFTWSKPPLGDETSTSMSPLSLGHATLDLALGTDGIPPGMVTTLMGPTGCGKTELALLYLLSEYNWKEHEPALPAKRSLFIAFRDTWESIYQILEGPVGRQLGFKCINTNTCGFVRNEHDTLLRKRLVLEHIQVGNISSAEILDRIRRCFMRQPPGVHFHRVVIDNVAYMDLTSPLVRDDVLFVPNLLEMLRREQVTPLFITSLVEGVVSESQVQTQIRDASHNLLVLRRSQQEPVAKQRRDFIALRIFKSQRLLHEAQALEVVISDQRDELVSANQELWRQLLQAILALLVAG